MLALTLFDPVALFGDGWTDEGGEVSLLVRGDFEALNDGLCREVVSGVHLPAMPFDGCACGSHTRPLEDRLQAHLGFRIVPAAALPCKAPQFSLPRLRSGRGHP